MVAFTLAILAFTPFLGVLAQILICLDGGVGPCIGGGCPGTTQKCINTTAGELCCETSQISTISATTTAPTTSTKKTIACIDRINPKTGKSDCPNVAYLCADAKYYQVMHVQCPKTCGRCDANGNTVPPVVPPSGCQDMIDAKTGVSNCAALALYCQNALYKDVMKQQCPKTCGYCQ